jgi:hypothetical protein
MKFGVLAIVLSLESVVKFSQRFHGTRITSRR